MLETRRIRRRRRAGHRYHGLCPQCQRPSPSSDRRTEAQENRSGAQGTAGKIKPHDREADQGQRQDHRPAACENGGTFGNSTSRPSRTRKGGPAGAKEKKRRVIRRPARCRGRGSRSGAGREAGDIQNVISAAWTTASGDERREFVDMHFGTLIPMIKDADAGADIPDFLRRAVPSAH